MLLVKQYKILGHIQVANGLEINCNKLCSYVFKLTVTLTTSMCPCFSVVNVNLSAILSVLTKILASSCDLACNYVITGLNIVCLQ